MILYTIACLFNVLLDFVTTYYMSRQITNALGFRTVDGRSLDKVSSFTEAFETYAMQRMLAENLYGYAWPSTFLVPFLLEPFVTIFVPLLLSQWIVRSHPEITASNAEEWLSAPQMEMGRYADILLNMLLAILIFYFPGGYTHSLFLGLVFAHLWIYFFDHCRVLRSVQRCDFASMNIDWWSQAMLAPCCAVMLSCLVFKANCQGYGFCLQGPSLVLVCSGAFLWHFVLHLVVLVHFVPRWGLKDDGHAVKKPTDTYKEVNRDEPCSWFTSNPVHCLRSKFIYKHERPCVFCSIGKEDLLEENEELGCFFQSKAVEPEVFDMRTLMQEVKQTMSFGSSSEGSPSPTYTSTCSLKP